MVDVIGYEGLYMITTDGKVFAVNKGIWLTTKLIRSGVVGVKLNKNGVRKIRPIHRLVADAYISNPENKPYVDHIDGNKHNNNVSNLRWCTDEENQAYRSEQGNEGSIAASKAVRYGDVIYKSISQLANYIANVRGSKPDTIRKELKAINYGGKLLYGKWCELV